MSNENQAMEMIKAIYDDGVATINGNDYHYGRMVHRSRVKVYAFMTKVQGMLSMQDMSFLDWEEFAKIEKVICDNVTFDGVQLSKRQSHWEQFPGDYVQFILVSMQVLAYPLYAAVS